MSINTCTISGNLTRDAELRQGRDSQNFILSFSVAVNDRRLNQATNEWEDRPNFIECVIFGKRAESLSRYLVKGTKVTVQGKLRWSQWQAQDGSNRSKVDVVVDQIDFMSRGNNQGAQGYANSGQNSYSRSVASAPTQSQGQSYGGYNATSQQSVSQAPVSAPQTQDFSDSEIPF